MLKNRKLIARFIIVALLVTPLSGMASVLLSSGHQEHCLEQSNQVDTGDIHQLIEQLCTMDECIDLCETLFHCSSHIISITSAEMGLSQIKANPTFFQDITTSHPGSLRYGLFRPPRL